MQTVASYLLERRDDLQWLEARVEEAKRLQAVVRSWLESKGSAGLDSEGTYRPEDGSSGWFKLRSATDEARSWWMLQLDEETTEGRRFSVGISITVGTERVSAYIKVEAGWTMARIMPALVDARCPRIVRGLLGVPGTWYHGSSILRGHLNVAGFDDGEGLAAEISHHSRAVPLVVVSTEEGRVALPSLDRTLAHDLAGIANVITVDEAAAWALTDILGVPFSCYLGAVRLYWPHFSAQQRFRRQLRGILFRAAALSVTKPREIDEIRSSVPDWLRALRGGNMKTSRARKSAIDTDTMRPEYDFSHAVRGVTAARYAQGTNVVLLEPDVAQLFPDSRAVNEALRTLARLARVKPRPKARHKRTA